MMQHVTLRRLRPRFDTWLVSRRSASHFPNVARLLLGVVGVTLIGLGCWAVFAVWQSDGGKVALLVIGAVLVVLATLGHLPEVRAGDWGVRVNGDVLEEVLQTIATEDPDLADTVRQRLSEAGQSKDARAETSTSGSNVDDDVEAVVGAVNKALPSASAHRQQELRVDTRGRRPIVDLWFKQKDKGVAVEVQSNWNRTIANLTNKRLVRSLRAKDVAGVAVLVPRSALEIARREINEEIMVFALDDVVSLADYVVQRLRRSDR